MGEQVKSAHRAALPLRFGISDSAHQCEGGLNGPGEPANSWAEWERTGRAEPAGDANQLWDRWPEHLDAIAEAGCDTWRTSVEWARVEPSPGAIDRDALDHYARILRGCADRGITPVLALHHFTYPAWLGPRFWQDPTSPERFRRWAAIVVEALGEHCDRWITLNEINASAIGSNLMGCFPPGDRVRPAAMVRACDHMLAAHVAASEVLHAAQPGAVVGTNGYAFWSYDCDRLLADVLDARFHGVERADLVDWLGERRRAFHDHVLAGVPRHQRWWDRAVHGALQAFLRIDRALPAAVDAVYASPLDRTVDVTQLSWYDPRLATYPKRPGRRGATGRRWGIDPAHWEQRPSPEHLVAYLEAVADDDREIWILENGLCTPVVDGVAHPRPDGWTRPRYLAAHLDAIAEARRRGVPVTAYFHWSLFDSYQWGDYEGCFGLRHVDREHATKLLELDALGDDSVAALRDLIATHRPPHP